MNKEEKKKKVRELMLAIQDVIDQGIDQSKDGDLYPHELVMFTTQLLTDTAVMDVAFTMQSEKDIVKKFNKIHEKFLELAANYYTQKDKNDEPIKNNVVNFYVDKKTSFDN